MKEVPGKRAGSSLFVYKNFFYNQDKRYEGRFRCSSRRSTGCPGLLIKNNDEYILQMRHNHKENSMILQIRMVKDAMVQMCRNTYLQPKEIFDTVCRENPLVAPYLSYRSMTTILQRERAKSRPSLPQSVSEFSKVLQNYEPVNLVYKGSVTATDGKMALVFSTKILLEALAISKEVYVDGLCSVVPREPRMSQLYTVHIRYMDKGICAVFVLCEARTTALYCAIWQKILQLAPGLQEKVEFTMSDYEGAALNALEKFFPTADICCCWFHFKQSVIRKWKSLGLKDEYSALLSMTTSLPLVPPDDFEEAIGILESDGKNDSNDPARVSRFLEYIRHTWLPLASKVSVFKRRLRTNNIVESFNRIASRKLGGNHPNIWVFLDHLKKLIQDQELDLGRLMNNQAVGRVRYRKNVERDAKISRAQTDLASGRLSLEQFLRMFGFPHHNNELEPINDDIPIDDLNNIEANERAVLEKESTNVLVDGADRVKLNERAVLEKESTNVLVDGADRVKLNERAVLEKESKNVLVVGADRVKMNKRVVPEKENTNVLVDGADRVKMNLHAILQKKISDDQENLFDASNKENLTRTVSGKRPLLKMKPVVVIKRLPVETKDIWMNVPPTNNGGGMLYGDT